MITIKVPFTLEMELLLIKSRVCSLDSFDEPQSTQLQRFREEGIVQIELAEDETEDHRIHSDLAPDGYWLLNPDWWDSVLKNYQPLRSMPGPRKEPDHVPRFELESLLLKHIAAFTDDVFKELAGKVSGEIKATVGLQLIPGGTEHQKTQVVVLGK